MVTNKPENNYLLNKICANLIHFFGIYNYSFVKKTCTNYYKLSNKNYSFSKKGIVIGNTSAEDELVKNFGQLVYSFQIGNYLQVLSLILESKHKLNLIVEKTTNDLRFRQLKKQIPIFKRLFGFTPLIEILSIKTPSLTYKIKHKIEKGEKVLIYFDGNSGVKKNKTGKSLLTTDFFTQKAFFRQGLALLSYLTRQPPVGICFLENNKVKIFRHEISFKEYNLKEYCNKLTSEIVKNLTSVLKVEKLYTWAKLAEINNWIDTENINLENYNKGEKQFLNEYPNLPINLFRYAPFLVGKGYYMFDKKRYLTYPITKKEYRYYVACSNEILE